MLKMSLFYILDIFQSCFEFRPTCALMSEITNVFKNITGLLERSDLSINSFEWIRTLKYEMDVHSILNAKSMTPDDSDKKNHQATPSQHDVASYGKMETPSRRSKLIVALL